MKYFSAFGRPRATAFRNCSSAAVYCWRSNIVIASFRCGIGTRRIDVDGAVERIDRIAQLSLRREARCRGCCSTRTGPSVPATAARRRAASDLLILEHRREIARRIVEMTDGLQLLRDTRRAATRAVRRGRLAADELSVADHADGGDRRDVAERPVGGVAGHLHRLRQAEERENRRGDVVDRHRMRAAIRRDVRTVGDEDAGIAVIGKRRAAVGHACAAGSCPSGSRTTTRS